MNSTYPEPPKTAHYINAQQSFIQELGNHRLHFIKGGRTLVVAFDNAARPRSMDYVGRDVWGQKFYTSEGFSLLGIISKRADWFRNQYLIDALEQLRDSGFFTSFERVVLIGASMGGFGATAFAPLAPGCCVIALSPQTTLDPLKFPWGGHSPEGPQQNWTLPYSDGCEGIRYAKQAYIIYDNLDHLDIKHAKYFLQQQHVLGLRLPGGGHGPAPTLTEIGIFKKLILSLISGKFQETEYYRDIRKRRQTASYFRSMRKYVNNKSSDWRTITLAHAEQALNRSSTSSGSTNMNSLRKAASWLTSLRTIKKPYAAPVPSPNNQFVEEDHRFLKAYPNLKRNIFIVTYGRSGSTLLQNILHTIPGCYIRGENHNVMETIWGSFIRARMARRTWGNELRPESHPWHGSDKIRPQLFAAGMIDAMVQHVLCPPKDSRYFGFKEIRYNSVGDRFPEMLDFMHAQFKDVFFVFNTRNVEDVSKSAWWKNWKPEDVQKLVSDMDQRFLEYHIANPNFTVVLSYENFSKDPRALKPLFDRLHEPFDQSQIEKILSTKLTH